MGSGMQIQVWLLEEEVTVTFGDWLSPSSYQLLDLLVAHRLWPGTKAVAPSLLLSQSPAQAATW